MRVGYYFCWNAWLDQGIGMNTVARVTIQRNPKREAVADVVEGVFVGELFCFHLLSVCECGINSFIMELHSSSPQKG